MDTAPIELDYDMTDGAASQASPWGAVIGAVTGIGGLLLSVFEWYYQQRLQKGENYWNNLISDADQTLTGEEQELDYYQSMATQAQQLESNYSNAVFSAPNKASRSHYQRLVYSTAQKATMYDQLEQYAKTLINNTENQIAGYRKSESQFSLLSHYEEGRGNSNRVARANKYEKYVRSGAQQSNSILSQIYALEKEVNSGTLTLSQLKSVLSKLHNLNEEMEANKQTWHFNTKSDALPDFMVEKITPVLKTVISKGDMAVKEMKKHGIHDKDVVMKKNVKSTDHVSKTVIEKRQVKH